MSESRINIFCELLRIENPELEAGVPLPKTHAYEFLKRNFFEYQEYRQISN